MEFFSRRTSSYCSVVEQNVAMEFSFFISHGDLQFCATCTGVEEKCRHCPIIDYNERYPPLLKKRLPSP